MTFKNYLISIISFVLRFFRNFFIINGVGRKNIVVISFHKIGDSIFTIPAIKTLYEKYGKNLTVVCYEENKKIYQLVFTGLNYVVVNKQDFYFKKFANGKIRYQIQKLSPKIVIDLLGNIQSASLMFAQKAEAILGFNEKEYLAGVYSKYITKRKTPHLIDTYLDVVGQIIPIKERQQLKSFPVDINKDGFILIHPFAGWKAKVWNLNKFIDLAKKLSLDYKCVLTFSEATIPQEELKSIEKSNITFTETKTLEDLIGIIKESSFFIGNDSGPVYIANLLGKPTFSIYGPTNPKFSLPFGDKHRFIQKQIKCSPAVDKQYCFTDAGRNGCPEFICMNSLSLDEVYLRVINFIQELGIEKANIDGGKK